MDEIDDQDDFNDLESDIGTYGLDLGDREFSDNNEYPEMNIPPKPVKKVRVPKNPKPKPKKGPGRPKKQKQPTAPGARGYTNDKEIALPNPPFDHDTVPYNRSVHTEDLIQELNDPTSAPEHIREKEDLQLAIDMYEEAWEKYPHLKLIPTLTHKQFDSQSNLEDVEREIDRIERLGTKPFKDKVYTTFWNMIVVTVTKLLAVTPLGENLEPEPSPLNPKPVKLSKELMKPEVQEQARPAIEEMFQMFPILEYLGNLGDPRIQLAYTISSTIISTYTANSDRIAENTPNVM